METSRIFIIGQTLIFWCNCDFMNQDTVVVLFIILLLGDEYLMYLCQSEITWIGSLISTYNVLLVNLILASLRNLH